MGCIVSSTDLVGIPNPPVSNYDFLCTAAGQKLLSVSELNTDKSFFYKDKSQRLWKMRTDKNKEELLSTYHNNFRAFLLPESNFLLKPSGAFHVRTGVIAIVMERGETDMFEMLQEKTDFECITNGLIQIADGISWLHKYGLAHRDIKPENIVYHQGRFKLIDFDFCSPLEEFTYCGTVNFMCSKSMTSQWKGSLADFSKRADVHAFGKTILFILWHASSQQVIPFDKRLYDMFYGDHIKHIELPGVWQYWFDVTVKCCSNEPPTKIPLLPLAITNTATTPNPITAKTTVKVFHAYPSLT